MITEGNEMVREKESLQIQKTLKIISSAQPGCISKPFLMSFNSSECNAIFPYLLLK